MLGEHGVEDHVASLEAAHLAARHRELVGPVRAGRVSGEPQVKSVAYQRQQQQKLQLTQRFTRALPSSVVLNALWELELHSV